MALCLLKSDLVRELQRALNGRGKGNQLPLAWAVGWQNRGTPDIHLVVLVPEDFPLTDSVIKAQTRRAIKAVSVLDQFELLDQSTGEISTIEYRHRFGKKASQVEICEATDENLEAAMTYLAVNTRQEPKRGGALNEVSRLALNGLQKIVSQQPGATPRHVKNLGYSGRRFGTSQNWGANIAQRRAARKQWARLQALKGSESSP